LAVGNILEVQEAIATLRGEGPEDFTQLCMCLGSYMLVAGGKAENEMQAREMLAEVIANGTALEKLAEFVKAQGGDASYVYEPEKFVLAQIVEEIPAPESGYIQSIVCDEIGICSLILGGGRETKENEIDLSVGLVLHKKVGDKVEAGESLATIYANDADKCRQAKQRFLAAYTIAPEKKEPQPLIKKVIMPSGWNEGKIFLI